MVERSAAGAAAARARRSGAFGNAAESTAARGRPTFLELRNNPKRSRGTDFDDLRNAEPLERLAAERERIACRRCIVNGLSAGIELGALLCGLILEIQAIGAAITEEHDLSTAIGIAAVNLLHGIGDETIFDPLTQAQARC